MNVSLMFIFSGNLIRNWTIGSRVVFLILMNNWFCKVLLVLYF